MTDLLRGFCRESEWTLLDKYNYVARDPETITLPKKRCHPDKIIELIKGELSALINFDESHKTATGLHIDSKTELSLDESDENVQNLHELIPGGNNSEHSKKREESGGDENEFIPAKKKSTSQKSLALRVISDNGIVLVPEMRAFMVKGHNNNKYSVTIFPNETCTCPCDSECYHILSVKISLGMPVSGDKKDFNLTQLRRNVRPKGRPGRKAPRKDDVNSTVKINPAPDSAVKSKQCEDVFDTPTANNTLKNSNTAEKSKRKIVFDKSTPRSILKTKSNESGLPSSDKKRKLYFADEDNPVSKLPKIDELSDIKQNTFENSDTNLVFDNSTPKSILKNKAKGKRPSVSNKKRKLCFEDDDTNTNVSKSAKIEELPDIKQNVTKHSHAQSEFSLLEDISGITHVGEPIDLDECNRTRTDNDDEHAIDFWIKDLGLTTDDKEDLIKNKKLNSHHMEAVNKLLKQIPGHSVQGLYYTDTVPIYRKNEEKWDVHVPMPSVNSPACQIHHTHEDHWVASIFHENVIYLCDSLGTDNRAKNRIIPDGLKIQLAQLYGANKQILNIKLPPVMKQNNSIDCGLFAIPFVTSYCVRKTLCFGLIFDAVKMRSHLLNCFETNEMTEFPRTSKSISLRRQKKFNEIDLQLYCLCNLPECVENKMVQCSTCQGWFHYSCVDAPADMSQLSCDFQCERC